MSFYQWETKTYKLTIEGAENPLDGWEQVIVSVGQNNKEVVRFSTINGGDSDEGIEVEGLDTIYIHLSQQQTGKFKVGKANIQVNVYYTDSERDTTVEASVQVKNNLHRRVMNG